MNSADEAELYRLTDLLKTVEQECDITHDQSRAIKQAAIALSLLFIDGRRQQVEAMVDGVESGLTDAQRSHLRELGLDADD
ncbi:MAG: hypothetical protein NXI22_15845 [bacterium]|nr:hypothetical protein [bacterium]